VVATVSELRCGVSGATHQHPGNARDENNSGRRGKLPNVRLNESPAQRRVSAFFLSADRFQRFSPLLGQDAYAGSQGSFQTGTRPIPSDLNSRNMNKLTWLITQSQIAAGDVESAIIPVDPDQVPDDEIIGLHGSLRMRIEGAGGMADVITDPMSRKFFRALHARWPWAGFFLRLDPVTPESPDDKVLDLAVFMSLLLVHVDHLTYAESAHGIALRYDANQFTEHLFDVQIRAAHLAGVLDLPPTAINARAALISRAVTSFFEAGQALHPPASTKRKKRK